MGTFGTVPKGATGEISPEFASGLSGHNSPPPEPPNDDLINKLRRQIEEQKSRQVAEELRTRQREIEHAEQMAGSGSRLRSVEERLLAESVRHREQIERLTEKVPKGLWGSLKAGLPKFVMGAGAAGGLYAGSHLIKYFRHRHEAEKNFGRMMENTPSLRSESPELVRNRFDTLHRFAPTLSRDPLVAGSIVRHWVEFPTVTADALKSVTSVEKDLQPNPSLMGALAGMVGHIGG